LKTTNETGGLFVSESDRIPPEDDRYHRPGLFAAFRTRRRADRAIGVVEAGHDERVARDAYDRGRRDERARRHRSPVLSLIVLVIAIAGGAMVYLAAREGSFTAGGHVVDKAIGKAAEPARTAADSAGNALESAGQSLKESGGSSPSPPP
jgi:hypothetical protein